MTAPEVSFSDASFLNVDPQYDVDWKLCVFREKCEVDDSEKKQKASDPTNLLDPDGPLGLENKVLQKLEGAGVIGSAGFPGVEPTEGSDFSILGDTSTPPEGEDPTAAEQSHSTLLVQHALTPDARAIEFDFNALTSNTKLTSGLHSLEFRLAQVDGSDSILLYLQPLDELTYQANGNPLGFAADWQTALIGIPENTLEPSQDYFAEFRLITDLGSGENVAVALDRLRYLGPEAQAELVDPDGILADRRVEFGAETADLGSYALMIANLGDATLNVDHIQLSGNGFSLERGGGDFAVLAGNTASLVLRVDDLSTDSKAVLRFQTNDAELDAIEIQLVDEPTLEIRTLLGWFCLRFWYRQCGDDHFHGSQIDHWPLGWCRCCGCDRNGWDFRSNEASKPTP